MRSPFPNTLACAISDFFSNYLPKLRAMSPHTVQSYRDSFVLLLRFVAARRQRPVSNLDVADIGAEEVIAFLNYLEQERANIVATRNVRLAAVHAFFRYLPGQNPDLLEHSQRILAIPFKRTRTRPVEYLEYEEIEAVLSAIDRSTPDGRRDYALLATMFNTGARVSEIIGIRAGDLQLLRPCHVRLFGKGRKERLCPLLPQTAQVLRDFCFEKQISSRSDSPVFLNHREGSLTRFGVRYILAKHLARAKTVTASLNAKRLHPHSMRHSAAVHLLKAGVDLSTISHWLGHASLNTTNRYAAIDLEMKRKALAQAKPLGSHGKRVTRWRTDTTILEWLEHL